MTPPDSSRPAHHPLPAPAPARITRIDWRRVTEMLAEGRSTGEVARELGCSRQHVWDILRRSRALDDALFDAERETGTNANLRLRGLRPKLADALASEVDKGNVRVILWLSERLQIADRMRSRGMVLPAAKEPLDAAALRALTASADADFSPATVDIPEKSSPSGLTVNPAG